ncbi:MAG: thiamine pyrophosphate-binding protein [Cupriavidus sp.]|nr:thiamine pyrophosphate-binding protein [Cupriavidus sp.]MCA3704355.1 thiamine pyrophosphate-binding protein [Methylobacterium sp.]
MSNGADIIARRLAAQGCRIAFGMPGGEVLALVEALEKAGIRFQLVKHENAGGFMAEGYWHAQSEAEPGQPIAPGILVATLGPGAANAANVVANAHQDRVPLIVLTGRVDHHEAESYTHQVFDHQAFFRPITKASLLASRGAVARVIDRAVNIAIEGQPGPVHVDVPIGVAEGAEPATAFSRPAPARNIATGDGFEAARAVFAKSVRPMIIAGVDAVNQQAAEAIRSFAERFAAPVLATYKAKGILPESHPLALGGAGLSPKADKLLLPFLAEADCIVLAGYDPIEMRINWRDPFPGDIPVIELSAVSPQHQMHRADHLLLGDVAGNLAALAENLPPKPGMPAARVAAIKASLGAAFAPERDWGPSVVFDTLRRLAPAGTVATADSGAHRILMSQMWRCEEPRGLLQSSGLCTMACSLPLAIGYQLARPDRHVIAVMGDAGLEMGIGELATLRDLRLPVLVVVLQDERLALIDLKQRASGRPQSAVSFGATDFAAIAKAYGGEGVQVSTREELEAAAAAAFARRDRFSLIAAKIAPDAYDGRL